MKKFIFLILLSIFSIGVVSAQSKINYEQKGTNFVQTTTKGSSTFDVKTTYTWEIKGEKCPIYITSRGACYIKRISSKTGKEYKQYLPKEIQEAIRKELKIDKK